MSRKNDVDVTFILFFSTIFQYQPIRCTNLIEVNNIFSHLLIDFAKCLPTCYVDQYFKNMTYSPGIQYIWTECKNRDPVFGFPVSRPHLETGERRTKHDILIHYSNKTEN